MICNLYILLCFLYALFEVREDQLAEFRARFSRPPGVSGKMLQMDGWPRCQFRCLNHQFTIFTTPSFRKKICCKFQLAHRTYPKIKQRAVFCLEFNFVFVAFSCFCCFFWFAAFVAFVASFPFPVCAAFVILSFGCSHPHHPYDLILIILMISFSSFLILINNMHALKKNKSSENKKTSNPSPGP